MNSLLDRKELKFLQPDTVQDDKIINIHLLTILEKAYGLRYLNLSN